MKFLLSTLVLFFISLSPSRNEPYPQTTDYQLTFGESITINEATLTFKELSADSRCPKEVMCIRAGEVIATVELQVGDQKPELIELTFFPIGVKEKLSEALDSLDITLEKIDLLPYPKALNNLKKQDYFINFRTALAH